MRTTEIAVDSPSRLFLAGQSMIPALSGGPPPQLRVLSSRVIGPGIFPDISPLKVEADEVHVYLASLDFQETSPRQRRFAPVVTAGQVSERPVTHKPAVLSPSLSPYPNGGYPKMMLAAAVPMTAMAIRMPMLVILEFRPSILLVLAGWEQPAQHSIGDGPLL